MTDRSLSQSSESLLRNAGVRPERLTEEQRRIFNALSPDCQRTSIKVYRQALDSQGSIDESTDHSSMRHREGDLRKGPAGEKDTTRGA